MKIPKYIVQALERRVRLANQLDNTCNIIDDFIRKNGLDDEIDTADWLGGVEIYVNPRESADNIIMAILNHKEVADDDES
ncbi:MAG: hypothetical protein K6F27_08400 [Ruminococcus sp.]|nr:hypothetical protein [Ruminococcus sp.]